MTPTPPVSQPPSEPVAWAYHYPNGKPYTLTWAGDDERRLDHMPAMTKRALVYATPPSPSPGEQELREALVSVRAVLERENNTPGGAINDTIWRTSYETLFDYIDGALAGAKPQQGEEG